LRDHPHVEFLD